MAIDYFTRQDFEAALPRHKTTGIDLWTSGGVVDGEYVYYVKVSDYVSIVIRSSVQSDGHSADTGEDSIRLWLVDPFAKTPMGPKLSKYVTRVNGWQTRMTVQLRTLWELGRKVRPCGCGRVACIFRVKQDGANKGRLFLACPDKHDRRLFEWLTDPTE